MSYVRPHPQNGDSMARSMIRGLGDPCVASDPDANPIQCAINQLMGVTASSAVVTGPGANSSQNLDALNALPVETNTGGNALSNAILGAQAAALTATSGLPWYTWVAIGLAGLFVVGVAFPPKR